MSGPIRILYVDDYPLDRELVRDALEIEHGGFEVVEAVSRSEFESNLEKGGFDLVLSDFNILGFEGLQVLEVVRKTYPNLPVVIVTGTGSEEVAAEAIKRGAADYILKTPKHIQRLPHTIKTILENELLKKARLQAEEALRESEDKFKYIFDYSPVGKSITQISGEIHVNQAFCTMLGYSKEELRGKKWPEISHPDDFDLTHNEVDSLLSGKKESARFTKRYIKKDGAILWADVSTAIRRDAAGKTMYFMTSVIDITERILAEEELNKSHDLLENLARLVPGVIYQYRLYPDGHSAFPYSSPGMKAIYEWSPEEVREDATPVFGRIHPDDYEMVSKAIFESAQTLKEFYCEFRVVLPGQGLRWRWSQAHPERTPDGGTLWHGIISDVTDRKIAEQALRESEVSLQGILRSTADGILAVSTENKVIFANERFAEMWKIPQKIISSKDDAVLLQFVLGHLVDPQDFLLKVQELYKSKESSFDTLYFKDGRVFERVSLPLIQDDDLRGRVWSFRDVTERKLAERTLHESETRFRTLFEQSPVGVALVETKTGRYLDMNPKYCDFIGYTREETKRMSFRDVTLPEELPENLDRNKALIEGKIREFSLEKRFICKGRGIKWGHLTAAPLWGKDESPAQYIHIAVVQDITERKLSEKLQTALFRIAQASDNSQNLSSLYPDIHAIIQEVMLADNFYIALYDEKNGLISYPYSVGEEFIEEQPSKPGKGLTEYVLRTAKSLLCDEQLEKEMQQRCEIELVGLPSPIWLGVPLISAGKAIGVLAVQDYKNARTYGDREKNILEFVSSQVAQAIVRKKAEEELQESEARYKSLVETQSDLIARSDLDGRLTFVNDAYCKAFGKTREELLGQIFTPTVSPEDRPIVMAMLKAILVPPHQMQTETRHSTPSGIRWLSWDNVGVLDEYGKVRELQGIGSDITERKMAEDEIKRLNATLEKRVEERTAELREAQEKIVRQEKLAVLGQLAGGIGHELRNPLGVINNAVYYLKMIQPEANEKVKSYHSLLEKEVHTAEKIIGDLLDFAKGATTDSEWVSIPDLVNRVLARVAVPDSVHIAVDFSNDLPTIRTDPLHLEQVMTNLITNACQAIVVNEGDSTKNKRGPGEVHIAAKKIQGMVKIEVTDTGVGIPPENMKKIFEPLFTTKLKGIGLGLAVSKKLIQANGGQIEVTSTSGKGSKFTVTLPIKKPE